MDALKFFGSLYGCKEPDKLQTEIEKDVSVLDQTDSAEDNLQNLIDLMTKKIKDKCPMKAIGTGHCIEWSNIGQTSSTDEPIKLTCKSKLSINKMTVLKENNTYLVCFEAGATLKEIQDCLWPKDKRETCEGYKILLNQTGCPDLSLSGTIATAAHGNGTNRPIIADMVRSFRLLTIDENYQVKQYQIEKKDGISDKDKFKNEFADVELIQNDEWFYATLVNIGCMGIVYSYILQTEDAYFLKENRTILTWDQAKEEIPKLYERSLKPGDNLHSFEVFVCPYRPIKNQGDIQVVICTLEKSLGPPAGKRPNMYFIQPEWIRTAFTKACENCPDIVPLLVCLMMNATTCTNVIMDGCTAMDPLSGIAVSTEVKVSECAARIKDSTDIITMIQSVIELYENIRKKNSSHLLTTPFALRFSKPSKAYMAMQYDDQNRHSVMIISNILKDTPGEDDTLKQFRDVMKEKYKGRPHWGMIHDMDAKKLEKLYPREAIKQFKKGLKKFDPNKVFANRFTRDVFKR